MNSLHEEYQTTYQCYLIALENHYDKLVEYLKTILSQYENSIGVTIRTQLENEAEKVIRNKEHVIFMEPFGDSFIFGVSDIDHLYQLEEFAYRKYNSPVITIDFYERLMFERYKYLLQDDAPLNPENGEPIFNDKIYTLDRLLTNYCEHYFIKHELYTDYELLLLKKKITREVINYWSKQ